MLNHLPDVLATEASGGTIARTILPGNLIFLSGELGAGKTSWVRGFLRALGHLGSVKSPTFTWVETYTLPIGTIHHFDLYRLEHPQLLHSFGLRDYLTPSSITLIEWPENGLIVLPEPTLWIHLQHAALGRTLEIKDNQNREMPAKGC